jgi:hypothetical protein
MEQTHRPDPEASPTAPPAKHKYLHQQSKGGRTNSRAKLAAATRRHASPPRSLLSHPSRSSAVSETGTTGVRQSPHQSASSMKRPFPLSDLRRALLADTALCRRRRRRRRHRHCRCQDAKWRGRLGWRSRAASIHAATAMTRLMALTGFGWENGGGGGLWELQLVVRKAWWSVA